MTDKPTRKPATDAHGDIQEKVDQAEEKGYFGTKVDPNPNEAYALTTGPESPRGPGAQPNIDDLQEETDRA